MAVFQFSALNDGQSIAFNPNADVLSFGAGFHAGSMLATQVGADTRVDYLVGQREVGKSAILQNTSPLQLATSNVTFANGSLALFGDNSTAQNDNLANSLTGTSGRDLLQGFGGADTLNGGLGDDVYVADPSDVLIDAGGTDMIVTDANWTLGADFEDLQMLGTGNLSVTGNNANNLALGNSGNNYFNMRAGDDRIFAGAGNDWIDMSAFGTASYGNDIVDGGAGFDTINFAISAGQQSAIVVDFSEQSIRGGGLNGAGSVSVTGVERVIGAGFNDTFKGGDAADTFEGREGNDTLSGMAGNDTLIGGTGQDTFLFASTAGAANADVVADFVSATDKLTFDNSVLTALGATGTFAAGDARFAAGAGFTSGRDASDRIVYNTTTGQLFYDADGNGSGASQLVATLQGAPALAATDIVVIGNNANTNQGTPGNDHVIGTEGNDSLVGLAGNDTLDGFGGNDTLDGGTGNDSLTGGVGADSMRGGDGDDTIDAASGTDHWSVGGAESGVGAGDTIDGGLGNDIYYVQANDVISDPGGIDTVRTNQLDYTLGAGFENLEFVSLSGFFDGEGVHIRYFGNALDNRIVSAGAGPGFGSSDTLDGGAGNDTLIGGGGETTFKFSLALDNYGHDQLDGSSGFSNTVDFSDARSAIVADLRAGTLTGGGSGGAGSATLVNISAFFGGAFDDRIIGSASEEPRDRKPPNGLHGGGGNDTIESGVGATDDLFGDAGNDRLVARGPNDHLEGGAGSDAFVFATAPGDNPNDFDSTRVSDFASGVDKIVLDGGFHAGVGASGNFSAGDERFFAAAGATGGHDTTDRVVYNTSTGELFYDADGSGGGQAQLIALLSNVPALSATDIAVENGVAPGQTINGTAGNDSLVGTAGDDTLNGLAGNDTLRGLAGNDLLDGGTGVDSLDGGLGNDTYIVTAGDVLVDAGGVDGVITDTNWTLGADFENLSMTGTAGLSATGNSSNNALIGNSGNNYFNARAGNDTIQAGAGNDWIDMSAFGTASYGDDIIDGGAGFDTVNFAISAGQQSAITVQLFNQGEITGGGQGGAGSAHLTSVERVIATSFGDWLFGSFGSDTFDGREGNDTIWGSSGNDTLTGGAGQDRFNFAEAPDATTVDLVTDFVSGTDKIGIDNEVTVFNAIGPDGDFTAGDARFAAGAGFTSGHDASDRIVYNTTTGQLFYDADGSGAGAAQLVATFQGAPAIAATDITVI
jgi:Ca2+-binding RTX toxin-like protein